MKNQGEYFDIPTYELSPLQIRAKLANLARPIIGDDAVNSVQELLRPKTTPNGGNDVTDDLKYTSQLSPSTQAFTNYIICCSQSIQTKWHPCFPHCAVGWSGRR